MRLLASHTDAFDPARPWEDLALEREMDARILRVREHRLRSPHTGREALFTRLACPEWMNTLAFTESGELLVVEQYRHGTGRSSLEIVGGVCEPGEAPEATARRELLEETGHAADTWVSLGSCAPNPAIQDNHCHFFLALGCCQVAPLDLDPSEELRVWAMTWSEWEARLRSGEIDHALVLVACLRLQQWEGWDRLKASLS